MPWLAALERWGCLSVRAGRGPTTLPAVLCAGGGLPGASQDGRHLSPSRCRLTQILMGSPWWPREDGGAPGAWAAAAVGGEDPALLLCSTQGCVDPCMLVPPPRSSHGPLRMGTPGTPGLSSFHSLKLLQFQLKYRHPSQRCQAGDSLRGREPAWARTCAAGGRQAGAGAGAEADGPRAWAGTVAASGAILELWKSGVTGAWAWPSAEHLTLEWARVLLSGSGMCWGFSPSASGPAHPCST